MSGTNSIWGSGKTRTSSDDTRAKDQHVAILKQSYHYLKTDQVQWFWCWYSRCSRCNQWRINSLKIRKKNSGWCFERYTTCKFLNNRLEKAKWYAVAGNVNWY